MLKPCILVTGAAGGVGKVVAAHLEAIGHEVVGTDIRFDEAFGLCPRVEWDLASAQSVRLMFEHVESMQLTLTGLVHLAGNQTYGKLADLDDAAWAEGFASEMYATMAVCREFIRHVQAHAVKDASIVLVGSVQSLAALPNSCAYVTKKHAMLGLCHSIAVDYAAQGIRCNLLCSGVIDSRPEALTPDRRERCDKGQPMLRMGTPQEVANVIEFLIGPKSSFMTGSAIVHDGGMMALAGGMQFNPW